MVKRAPKQPKRPKVRKPRLRTMRLDSAAIEYAQLLANPCNARIVHPIFPGGDAGYLFRAESFATFANSGGATGGIVHWSPGYVNSSGSELVGTQTTDPTLGVASTTIATATPGKTFLSTNARGVRCVAACVKVTFPGAESGRSGRIHYGLTSAGVLDLGQSVSVDGLAQTLQNYTRTPPETIELVWRPSIADTEFNDPSEAAVAALRDRKTALTFAWAGLPANTGLTFQFVAVYEWTPAVALGVGHNTMGKAVSRNTLDDVLDYIKETGFTYVRQMGQSAGNAIGSSLMSGIYGLMPSRPSRRAINFV